MSIVQVLHFRAECDGGCGAVKEFMLADDFRAGTAVNMAEAVCLLARSQAPGWTISPMRDFSGTLLTARCPKCPAAPHRARRLGGKAS